MQGMGVSEGCSVLGKARTEDVEVQETSSLSVVFCRSKKISNNINSVGQLRFNAKSRVFFG